MAAFRYLTRQTDFGPRAPGSPGHARCLVFLKNELRRNADRVETQPFIAELANKKHIELTNIVASFNLQATKRILISAHWDSRMRADQDPDKHNWDKPILGANDGASGTAIILELARELRLSRPKIGVDLVLFDGEDVGVTGKPETFSLGSRFFATHLPDGFRADAGINIDMVGDKELRITRERNSEELAPQVQRLVFETARTLGVAQFSDSAGEEITDDHLPLNRAGIPTIDLIDFAYPDESNKYWHTLADTPDKCSAESLAAVGKVLLSILSNDLALDSRHP